MNSIDKKSTGELRKFGITMTVAIAVIGVVFLWKDISTWKYLFSISGLFLIIGLLRPGLLWPIEWLWMKVSHFLGIVMTYILLTITYYLIITPLGIIFRIIGKDSLNRKFDRRASSYWIRVDPDGPVGRPDKPF